MLNFLPGKSIKTQLIGILFSLTTIAIVIFGFFAVKGVIDSGLQANAITAQAMTERVEQFLIQTTIATAEKNSILFKGIIQKNITAAEVTKNILSHPEKFSNNAWYFDAKVSRMSTGQYTNSKEESGSIFISKLTPITQTVKRELEVTSYLDYLFPQILASEPNVVAIYFDTIHNSVRYYPNIGLAAITPPDFDIAAQEFYYVADPKHNPEKSTKWTSVYDDPAGNGLLITGVHPIYLDNGTFVGSIGIDVTLTKIAQNIESYSPIESSYTFLIDNNDRAIALPAQGHRDLFGTEPKKGEFGVNLKGVKGDFLPIVKNMTQGKKGFASAKVGSNDLYIAYAPVAGTPFSLAIVAQKNALLKVVSDLEKQMLFSTMQILFFQLLPAGLFVLGLVWLFGFIYIDRLTAPIKHLTAQTAIVANGNFDIEPTKVYSTNEVSHLASSFDKMVTDLRTSRQKIEEQNKELLHTEQTRLKASINSLNIGFIMTDMNNEVILLNETAKKILTSDDSQHDDTDQIAKTHIDTWTTQTIDAEFGNAVEFKKHLDSTLQTGTTGELKEVDFRGRILHIFMAPIREGMQSLGVVVLIEDITEIKQLERSKDEFFSIASHELRTPLTAIRGNSSMLQDMYSSQVKDKDFHEMIADIHTASIRLIGIVNDFLDAARLEQGRIKFENTSFAIEELLQDVVHEMTVIAKEKGNQLIVTEAAHSIPAVVADRNRVKQIVYNLVGNAMKFTQNGSITLDARVKDNMLQILVSDTGLGISQDNQRMLFHKFHQLGSSQVTRDATSGTGLGLYISKLLSEQMGGTINLDHSEVEHGSTFSFTLPLQPKSS